MSVFTPLTRDQLEPFLAPYRLGRLRAFEGIAAGSENSNFFVSLDGGEYVLTLVERGPQADLPFFVELLEALHQADLPVPYALTTETGEALRALAGKPALLQPRLPGRHVHDPAPAHCTQVGQWLARLHLATAGRVLERRSDRGLDWMLDAGPRLLAVLDAGPRALLEAVLGEVAAHKPAILALPRANLHADLFRDNVLFEAGRLTGVIDFYNACAGPMLYDVAIAVNDWCSLPDGALDPIRAEALLAGYAALRPFVAEEAAHWPRMLRIACVRFWLSRLIAAQAHAGQAVLIHDPAEFQQRLVARQQVSVVLPGGAR